MGQLYEKMEMTMKIYGLSERTQKAYLTEMRKFVKFFMISPDKMTKEQLYEYQKYLINERNAGHSTMKIVVNS